MLPGTALIAKAPANATTSYNIRAGEKFSVVEQIKAGNSYYYTFERGITEEFAKKNKLLRAGNAVVNQGESHLLNDGTWEEASKLLADPFYTKMALRRMATP
ncbi:MAG: hypothetical protein RR757_05890 [Raoultibacter sp.]